MHTPRTHSGTRALLAGDALFEDGVGEPYLVAESTATSVPSDR